MNGEREWQRAVRRAALRRGSQSERGQRDRPVRLARGGVTRRELHALRPRVGNGVLRRLAADEEFVAPERVERAVESEKGGGRPLEQTVRGPMEVALGADLSDVRVHDDAQAAGLNQDLSARAFTHGSDIFFGAGEYAPQSGQGQHLLAHELAHVMQQRDGAKLMVGAANDPAEREADAVAQAVAQRLQSARQPEEEAQMLRRQAVPEEEEEEVQALRRQEIPEEEEEAVQALRRQEAPEEEELL